MVHGFPPFVYAFATRRLGSSAYFDLDSLWSIRHARTTARISGELRRCDRAGVARLADDPGAEHGCVERSVAFGPALPTAPLDPGNLFERGDVEVACAHLTVSQYGVCDPWYAIFMYCIPFLVLVRYPCWNSQGLKQEFFPAASRRYRYRRLPRSETIQTSARGGLRRCPSIDRRVETRAKISDAVERDHAPISAPRNWT